ncbi:MMPL family transporter [Streptomyces sp. NPDC021098]|uniref:MMPL family transporter n=1 Tax=unclassified Streptomyces TaxID=2593676 RepID=UPI0037A19FE4
MDDRFRAGAPDLVLLISDKRGVDSPAVAAAGARLTERVARELLSVLLVIRILTLFTEVSALAGNVTTGLGLGLAIDYSLILIKRYREERGQGAETDRAIATTLRTAGRTVLFSAVTVTLALGALLVFPFSFLRSFAYAGIPTALLAAFVSFTFLPALLKVLDHRIEKGRILRRRTPKAAAGEGFWHRLATGVMRFPLPVAGAVTALLLLLGAPFLDLRLSLPDERVLPAQSQARQVGGDIRETFPAQETQALNVVLDRTPGPGDRNVAPYAERLSKPGDVSRVDSEAGTFTDGRLVQRPTDLSKRFGSGHSTYLSVVPSHQSLSEEGHALVADIRALPSPYPVLNCLSLSATLGVLWGSAAAHRRPCTRAS